jgi:hypothetical protein
MKWSWEVKFGDVIHIAVLLLALIGLIASGSAWKQSMEDKMAAISQQADAAKFEAATARQELKESMEHVAIRVDKANTRLSRIEGRLNIRDGEGD